MDFSELPSLSQTIRQAMALDSDIFATIQSAPNGIWIALVIVLLAGFSESLGQSVVLLVNQISPKRFALAISISTLSHLAGYVLWAGVVWLIGNYIFGREQPFVALASVVGLAYAPQLLAFFILIPFLGNVYGALLSIWSLLAIVVAIRVGLNLELWQAVATSGLGWVLVQLWRRTLGSPIYAIGRWLENRAAGKPLTVTWADLPNVRRRRPAFLEPTFLDEWRSRLQKSRQNAVNSVDKAIQQVEKQIGSQAEKPRDKPVSNLNVRKLKRQRPSLKNGN